MVAVLLSTYNGGEFLSEQLNSILSQTYNHFVIYIRDDKSNDSTVSIINEYVKLYPKKIIFVKDELGNVGVMKSFSILVEKANADYYFFCDQDDIWEDFKIELFLTKMKKMNSEKPMLAVGDYEIVSQTEKVIYKSFKSKYFLSLKDLENGIFKGFIPGCTMAFNNELKKNYMNFYLKELLHDTQLYLLNYLFKGQICFIEKTTLKYRVHSNNTIGVNQKISSIYLLKDLVKFFFKTRHYKSLIFKNYMVILRELELNFDKNVLNENELFDLNFVNNLNYFKRVKWLLKHFKVFSNGIFDGIVKIILI